MFLKKIFLLIFNFIKKIYFLPFNFMIGKTTRKFERFYIHMVTVTLFIFIFMLVTHALISDIEFMDRLSFFLMVPMVIILFTCMTKLMMYWDEKIHVAIHKKIIPDIFSRMSENQLQNTTGKFKSIFTLKNIPRLIIASGLLSVVAIAMIIVISMSYLCSPIHIEPPVQLINGGIVTIRESRTFEIFIEDSEMSTLMSYDFSFRNSVTQNIFASYTPARDVTYSIGVVSVNDVVVSGRFGRLVALVDLEPGNYFIEFAPWDGPGIFVWGTNAFGVTIRFAIQLVVAAIFLCAFSFAFIILFKKYKELKQFEAESERRLPS